MDRQVPVHTDGVERREAVGEPVHVADESGPNDELGVDGELPAHV